MPIKWTDQAHLTLLLKLLEVNPITKFDTEAISATWPGPEKPTPRAIYEQIKNLRKRAEANSNGGGAATKPKGHTSSVSKTSGNGRIGFKASKPRSAASPAVNKGSNGSATKKRKFNVSDDESEAVESTATDADADADADTQLESGGALARNLPVRKSRTANYNLDESDSEGGLDAAVLTNSDEDSSFAPERSGGIGKKTRRRADLGRGSAREQGEGERDGDVDGADEAFKMFTRGYDQVDGAGDGTDELVVDSGEDAEDEDDGVRSMTTMATRRTSWATACEEVDEY